MALKDDITTNWRADVFGSLQLISSLPTQYPGWTIKTATGVGVAVAYAGTAVREDFTNATIYCETAQINGVTEQFLILSSKRQTDDPAFLNLCVDFLDPGDNGEFRTALTTDPISWWRSWKELLGNVSIDERVYDVLGELAVLKYYVENNYMPAWHGPDHASYDIETPDFFVEVKSSVNRSKKEVTISSIYQLSNLNKKLYLAFCTFEPAEKNGISINSVVDDLRNLGYNVSAINAHLEKMGFGEGKSARKKRFLLHSVYQYAVDNAFPKIAEQSFVGGVLPAGITDISYTVDLSNLTPQNLIGPTP